MTSKLLQISPGYYIDLLLSISPDKSRKVIRKALRDEIRVRQKDAKYLESDPFGKQLEKTTKSIVFEILKGVLTTIQVYEVPERIIGALSSLSALLGSK